MPLLWGKLSDQTAARVCGAVIGESVNKWAYLAGSRKRVLSGIYVRRGADRKLIKRDGDICNLNTIPLHRDTTPSPRIQPAVHQSNSQPVYAIGTESNIRNKCSRQKIRPAGGESFPPCQSDVAVRLCRP
ncbi:hypothetical protein JYU34_009433 [Plutella xylostella]|uniref:Uncharacterized protein n=1 Tax=Plutella xylostella TaxID=51655 RepID=A0ABQ7QKR1_PLUXY|nr:hypothetical protein JYU34_009433 [Plutella xylostella]